MSDEQKEVKAHSLISLNICNLCKGLLWVCEKHPNHPWNGDCCKGAGVPCECNKELNDPRGFIRIEEL